MRVLHITNNYPTDKYPVFGIFVKEQIESLSKIGIDNDVFFINGREKGKVEYLKSIYRIWKHLSHKKYDIIHCHHFFSSIIYILTFKTFVNKSVLSYQNDPTNEEGLFLFKFISLFFNKIIFKNESKCLKYKNTICFPNGVDLDFFKPIDKKEAKKYLNLNEDVNYIMFMDSYKLRTQKRIDRFNAVIEYIKKRSNYNIEPIILTNTERKMIPYYINASTLHLLTSDYEGSPNSLKECLACNIPVVSTNVGGVDYLLSGVKGCYLSSSFEIEEIAELVISCLRYLEKNEFNGRDSIIQKELGIDTVAVKLKALYNGIINKEIR